MPDATLAAIHPEEHMSAVKSETQCPRPGSLGERERGSLKIVHVVSSLMSGGMEEFALRLAAAQRVCGDDAHILALRPGPLSLRAEQMGVPYAVLGGRSKWIRASRYAWKMASTAPDVIHAHNETSLHYAVLGKRVTGARVVMTDHGQPQHAVRTATEREHCLTDAVVAVSAATAARRADDGGRAPLVIRNGIAVPLQTRECPSREGLAADDACVAVIVARMDGRKGHDDLLQALAILKTQGTSLTAWMVGDGAERPDLESLAARLSLTSDHVRFLGYRSDVSSLLAMADFFVLPSLSEGLPMSILEAMAAGLPTVATPVGGIPELIASGVHGIHVPVHDPAALAVAMAELAGNEPLRKQMGRCAYARVRAEFSFDDVVSRYKALYAHVVDRRRGSL